MIGDKGSMGVMELEMLIGAEMGNYLLTPKDKGRAYNVKEVSGVISRDQHIWRFQRFEIFIGTGALFSGNMTTERKGLG